MHCRSDMRTAYGICMKRKGDQMHQMEMNFACYFSAIFLRRIAKGRPSREWKLKEMKRSTRPFYFRFHAYSLFCFFHIFFRLFRSRNNNIVWKKRNISAWATWFLFSFLNSIYLYNWWWCIYMYTGV